MKPLALLFFLPLAVQATPSPVDPYLGLVPFIVADKFTGKVYKTEKLPASAARPGVTHVRLWHGPIKVGSESLLKQKGVPYHDWPKVFLNLKSDFPRDITVLQASSTLVFKDGTPATVERGIRPRELSILSTNQATATWTSAFTCDGKRFVNRLPFTVFTNSNRTVVHYSSIDSKFNAGFYIEKYAELSLGVVATSLTSESKEVYSVTDLEYLNGDRPGFLRSTADRLSVTQCDVPYVADFNIYNRQKKYSIKSTKPVTAALSGYMVTAKGKLRNGGVNVLINLNGKQVCDSKAVYAPGQDGQASNINQMTPCEAPIRVMKGDKLTFEAFFDEDKHPQDSKGGEQQYEGPAWMEFSYALDHTELFGYGAYVPDEA